MDESSKTRRPIASRNSKWAIKTASFLASENISPNFISIMSMVFALLALLCFYGVYIQYSNPIILLIFAILFIQLRLIMNLLDGMVAVEHNKKSVLGGLYNEVPDRISDSLIIFGFGLLAKDFYLGIDLTYLAIILAIGTAYIRALGASLTGEHYFSGPMAKQQRMFLICIGSILFYFYQPAAYYLIIFMNITLMITCYRRLMLVVKTLKQNK